MEVTVTGGQGSSHTLTDQGPSPDVVRIGDGNEQLDITSAGEMSTHDTEVANNTSISAITLGEISSKIQNGPQAPADSIAVVMPTGTLPALVNGRLPVDVGASISIDVADVGFDVNNFGTQETGVPVAAGATGVIGWLSSIYRKLTQTLTVSVSNFPATQPVSGTVAVSNFPATQPVSGTFWQATQPVSAASLPLPTGAATETTLAAMSAKLPAALVGGRLAVDVAGGGTVATTVAGKTSVTTVRNVYTTTAVLNSAWTQLVAALPAAVSEIEIFDSNGNTMELGVGAAASEARVLYIIPGGNGRVPLAIASGARISLRATAGNNATSGEIVINFYG